MYRCYNSMSGTFGSSKPRKKTPLQPQIQGIASRYLLSYEIERRALARERLFIPLPCILRDASGEVIVPPRLTVILQLSVSSLCGWRAFPLGGGSRFFRQPRRLSGSIFLYAYTGILVYHHCLVLSNNFCSGTHRHIAARDPLQIFGGRIL